MIKKWTIFCFIRVVTSGISNQKVCVLVDLQRDVTFTLLLFIFVSQLKFLCEDKKIHTYYDDNHHGWITFPPEHNINRIEIEGGVSIREAWQQPN